MLTLQQLLESDSIATIVAKLNQNFQSLTLSNGGPQGIIGRQGIPGLPGRVGPHGPTGPQGPTGTIAGIIPFSAIPGTGTTAGPDPSVDSGPNYGKVGPWPQSSWQWLKYYHSNGVTIDGVPHVGGKTPRPNDIYIDHANNGYWKFLNQPDEPGAHDENAAPPYTQQGAYSAAGLGVGTYPNLGVGLGWVGSGWYYYPTGDAGTANLTTVWLQDTSTYLLSNLSSVTGQTGPYAKGAYENAGELEIPNARLITKYGTVWITSGNDATDTNVSYADKDTSTIGLWGAGSGNARSQPARNNSGIDRLLFKMSLDGLPYLSNIEARGIVTGAQMSGYPDTVYPQKWIQDTPLPDPRIGQQMIDTPYWVSPQYGLSLEKYTPLLFLTQRDDTKAVSFGTYGSLGIYMYTDTTSDDESVPAIPDGLYGPGTTVVNNNVSKTIHLFTSRYSVDPLTMFQDSFSAITSASTKNYGEMLLDFRRVTASNQYVCSLPTDLKLSSDYVAGAFPAEGDADVRYYDEKNASNTIFKFKTNQGYISAINGKAVTGDSSTANYWEYGLGGNTLSEYAADGGTHDTQSGTSGMRTRRSWYGSSVLSTKPSDWNGGTLYGEDNYIRVAGMMERGRRHAYNLDDSGYLNTSFLSELIFYTSGFTKANADLPNYPGITNDEVNPSTNAHRSLPSLYVSPFTNIGIGTFVGGYLASNDQGPLEPAGKLHVHLKETTGLTDPSQTYNVLSAGSGNYSTLPNKTYAVAAFTGDINQSTKKGNIDVLLGSLSSQSLEYIAGNEAPVNLMRPLAVGNQLRNAIRSEAWSINNVSTLRLGAQPFAAIRSIGRTTVDAFRNEFQIALHPLNVNATDLSSSLTSITGVGIHNMFPRARVHFFGKNTYNESEYGSQLWTPGLMTNNIGTSFPYYGATSVNSASANQVVVDYIGDSYKYPVGLYEYQYYVFNIAGSNPVTTGLTSPNSAVYPSREILSPTRFAVPYGAPASINLSYPSTNPQVVYNNSYKHGGVENAWWEPSSFIGFNLYRDLSNAGGNNLGDNRDTARWILGTQGTDGLNHGNNGGAAIISSNTGELGIITIPRGRDGGRAYEEWEQRGLGTRDVLNQMKIIFDKNGNIAIGNAAGWDLDAYPSLQRNNTTGYLNYVPFTSPLTGLPASALNASTYVYSLQTSGARRYGGVNYTLISLPADTLALSTAANVNKNSSSAEYVRIEVGAEKAWSRDGRMAQKLGYGYPTNSTITISGSLIAKYIKNVYLNNSGNSWVITTDAEGRIVNNQLTFTITPTATPATSPVPSDFITIFPHPTEFNTGGPLSGISGAPSTFTAPAGAIAAEWWGMSTDTPTFNNLTLTRGAIESGSNTTGWNIQFIPTTDTRGSANVRLNNFVYGEGFGFSGTSSQASTGIPRPTQEGDYTKNLVRQKRQESPKLILSFLEKTPNTFEADNRLGAGADPYLKVNTVIQSAQNEAALREYWIPKTDNTGGTFMVFTDHFGKKEKDSGFDDESIIIGQSTPGNETTRVGLHLEEVVTQEFLAGYSGSGVTDVDSSIITEQSFLIKENDRPVDFYPGYVRYYNRSYNYLQQEAVFANTTYGQLVDIGPTVTPPFSGSPNTSSTTGGSTVISPNKSSYKIAATQPLNTAPPLLSGSSAFSRTIGTMRPYNCSKTTAGTNVLNYLYGFQSGGTSAAAYTQPALKNNSFVTNTVTGDPFLWSDFTGVITIATSGNYEFKFNFGSASVSRCDNNTMVCDSGSVRFQQDEYRDVSLNLYVNGNYETNVLIAFASGGTKVCPPTAQPNIKSPSSGERTYTAFLSAGATIKLEYDFRGQARYQCYGVGGDSCGSNNSYISNYNHTGNISFSLKSLDAPCSNTIINGQPSIAIGGEDAPNGWNALFQKPEDIYYSCPAHTMINVYDTISANSGTHTGSIASHLSTGNNANYIQFQRQPILHDYDGIKITIDIAARAPNDKRVYTTNKDLVLRFLQSGYDLASITATPGSVPNIYVNGVTNKDVLYGVIPGKLSLDGQNDFVYVASLGAMNTSLQTPNVITGIWVYDGTVELYMTKATWESGGSNDVWSLCGAFFTKGIGQFTSDNNYATISGEAWLIDRLSITFEELISNTTSATTTTTTTTTIPNSATGSDGGANRSSIRRNIDHFYSIYSPYANYDNGWNTLENTENVSEINNSASSIRMKRINSEFALVDFNITVRVDNPYLSETAADSLIDFGSPRFTQYLRFTYIPDEAFWAEDQYRQDIAQDLFGNGMWFSNWSSYKNWLSGTAIVGDDVLNVQGGANLGGLGQRDTYGGGSVGFQPHNISSDWSPTFNDENEDSINYRTPYGRTWNGNILEMLSFQNRSVWQEMAILRGSTNYGILSDPLGNINGNGFANAGPGQSVFSAFGGDGRMLRLASTVFNLTDSASNSEKVQKQKAFAGFLGGMHAMWGNQAFERNTNVQWRMSPTYNYIEDQTVETAQNNNNGFSLEVQFSKPMLHVDTPLGVGIYGGNDSGSTVQPYRFLTVSGQGIVRYAQTIKDPLPTVRVAGERSSYIKSLYE